MIEQLLKDPNTKLTDEFFAQVLGNNYKTWETFSKSLSTYDISIEWRYYKDGGWLGKALNKKRTIFWGSLSDGFFSASFNFSNKPELVEGIENLDISDDIKNDITATPSGKYIGVTINISKEAELLDLYKMIDFKKLAK
ncbi:MAG: DUF3788 domain-containing protein [Oscillospiraceae bacterium]|nr:DUF3788 domain-containing protein [Oscillospiraceae bacterium]